MQQRLVYHVPSAPAFHPQKVMRGLGIDLRFTVLDCTPQSLGDCWWFWVEWSEYDTTPEWPPFVTPADWLPVGSC